MVWWFLWNSNLYYTAAPGPESTREIVGCHYWQPEQMIQTWTLSDLKDCKNVKHLSLVPQLPRSRRGSISELLSSQKNITFTLVRHWNSVEPGFAPHTRILDLDGSTLNSVRTGWIRGFLTLGEQHTHIYTTHTHIHDHLLNFVQTAHAAANRSQLGVHVARSIHTHVSQHPKMEVYGYFVSLY